MRYLWQNATNVQDRCGPRLFARCALLLAAASALFCLPFTFMSAARTPGWAALTKGPMAVPILLIGICLGLFCCVSLFMVWLFGHHLCRRRANDIGLTDWLQKPSWAFPWQIGPLDWLGRDRNTLRFETNILAISHILNCCMLVWLPLSARLLLSEQQVLAPVAFLLLGAPLAIFARFPSFPGTNPYGPNPFEAPK